MTDPNRYPPYVEIPISHRRRRLPDLMPILADNRGALLRAERQAVNAYVQGFAANITKLAMQQLNTELAELPAQILAQVHDEIVVRVHKSAAPEVLDTVQRVMSGITDLNGEPILGEIPLVVSAASGPSWAEAKQRMMCYLHSCGSIQQCASVLWKIKSSLWPMSTPMTSSSGSERHPSLDRCSKPETSLRKAVAGTLISFLSEVLLTVHLDERLPGLVPEEAGGAKTTASL